MKRIILTALLVILLSSCACNRACSHLRDLGCEEGFPLEDGTTCEQFCNETQENGHYVDTDKVCKIRTCDELMN